MGKTVLIVDDSVCLRHAVKMMLENGGYQVIEAENGSEALNLLKSNSVHLLLVDLNMPEMDGISLTRHIREDPQHQSVPVVIVTTETNHAKMQAGREAGATAWVEKPFTPEQLLSVAGKVVL